jgi:hypothetical protein
MVVDDEPFLSVVGARLVWADDPEYLAFSEEHATRTRTGITRAAPDPLQIVAYAAERAVRTVVGRLSKKPFPRILRADVIYRGKRKPEPFFLELDAVMKSPIGISVLEVKLGRLKRRASARNQLERFAKIAGTDLGPLNLVATIVFPMKTDGDLGTPGWPRIRLGDLMSEDLPERSTLYVDVHDLLPLFSDDERAALDEYKAKEEIRRTADRLARAGDINGAATLRASVALAPRPDGTITIDDDGIRVVGADAANWLARKIQAAKPDEPSGEPTDQ